MSGHGKHAERAGRRMRRAVRSALAAMLIVAGIGLCAYPAIAERISERRYAEVISGYAAAAASLERDDREAMLADARRYNAALRGSGSNRSGLPSPDDLLNPNGDGVMGVLAIPKIDLWLPIRHGVDETALATGVGHMPGSALPIGGDGNRSILAGHRGLPSAELFTRLDELEPGDPFSITVLGATHVYRVTDIRVVDPSAVGAIGAVGAMDAHRPVVVPDDPGAYPTSDAPATTGPVASDASSPDISAANPLAPVPGRDLITLVTCTPYGVNTHRLLVTGERAPDLEPSASIPESSTPHPIRIPTSPDAWFRSGWAAALATLATAIGIVARALVRTVTRRILRIPRTSRPSTRPTATHRRN